MFKILLSDFSRVILFTNDRNYRGSLNELFQQAFNQKTSDFFDTYNVNQPMLDFYDKLKKKYGLKAHIYTSGLIHRHTDLTSFLAPIFDGDFTVADTGKQKSDAASFAWIAQQLGVKPEEMLFIDDSMTNVAAAKTAGVHAVQFKTTEQVVAEVEGIFNT